MDPRVEDPSAQRNRRTMKESYCRIAHGASPGCWWCGGACGGSPESKGLRGTLRRVPRNVSATLSWPFPLHLSATEEVILKTCSMLVAAKIGARKSPLLLDEPGFIARTGTSDLTTGAWAPLSYTRCRCREYLAPRPRFDRLCGLKQLPRRSS
jgi:hypothetical protein